MRTKYTLNISAVMRRSSYNYIYKLSSVGTLANPYSLTLFLTSS